MVRIGVEGLDCRIHGLGSRDSEGSELKQELKLDGLPPCTSHVGVLLCTVVLPSSGGKLFTL